jgi:hypothetical protein
MWLKKNSPTMIRSSMEKKPSPSTRWRSGPVMVAALTSPESNRLAAVDSFSTYLTTTSDGKPGTSLVGPSGPQE